MEYLKQIIQDLLTLIYQYTGISIILSILILIVWQKAEESSWKNVWKKLMEQFKKRKWKKRFVAVLYIVFVLQRTVFNRSPWGDPLSNVIGNWWLIQNGIPNYEMVENILLFIPLYPLVKMSEMNKKSKFCYKHRVIEIVLIPLFCSFLIEIFQLLLRVGTFQLSDLCYNTLGGTLGALIYYCVYLIKNKKSKKRKKQMKKTTLLIMAAGIGSRFGTGIKQLEPVGLHDEIIMDYSIHDAISAGFNKIIFVIRKDIEADFRERIGNRVEAICASLNVEIAYAFQDLSSIPNGYSVPNGRTKPWGTGQAVLAAKDLIHEPFAVINADDYYGKEAFRRLHDWLILDHNDSAIAMAGFILKNTLSDNGGVTRGVCKVAEGHTHITDVVETNNIVKTIEDGMIGAEANGVKLAPGSYVSMNFWGFPAKEGHDPAFLTGLEDGFKDFFEKEVPVNPQKAEYLLPTLIGGLLRDGKCTVKVLETKDNWFGVTYKEDKAAVVESFKKLIADGVYRDELYSDL